MNDFKLNTNMSTKGTHIIADYWDCSLIPDFSKEINVIDFTKKIEEFVKYSGATIIDTVFHNFKGTGYSATILLAESHFSIHVWPKEKYISFDIYTCGNINPKETHNVMKAYFSPHYYEFKVITRGVKNGINQKK